MLESVPQAATEHPPESFHVTPALFGSFATVAVKFCVELVWTLAEDGVPFTLMGGAVTVISTFGDVTPPADAVMFAVPAATPVTTLLATDAMLGASLAQTALLSVLRSLYVTIVVHEVVFAT